MNQTPVLRTVTQENEWWRDVWVPSDLVVSGNSGEPMPTFSPVLSPVTSIMRGHNMHCIWIIRAIMAINLTAQGAYEAIKAKQQHGQQNYVTI